MILNDDEIGYAVQSGAIAGRALAYGRKIIKPGEKISECLDRIEQYILDNKGAIAFPAQVSLNDVAAHSCPLGDDQAIFKSTDIIKLDLGVHIEGFIGDTACTIIFEEDNEDYARFLRLKKASEDALRNALGIIRPGVTLGEIGRTIQETIAGYDLSPIKNLSGHGLGRFAVHESPTIPNFDTNDHTQLHENQHIAIEPFATDGHGMIYESANPTLFALSHVRIPRSQLAREILKDIEKYNGLPFTMRWLTSRHNISRARLALSELKRLGTIIEYPPLIESRHGFVSQSEHTIIVKDRPKITTKIDEE